MSHVLAFSPGLPPGVFVGFSPDDRGDRPVAQVTSIEAACAVARLLSCPTPHPTPVQFWGRSVARGPLTPVHPAMLR